MFKKLFFTLLTLLLIASVVWGWPVYEGDKTTVGNRTITGDLTVTGDLAVTGNSTITGNLTGSVNSGATYVVCSSTANSTWKCDYTADGTNDDVQIQAAIDACPTIAGAKRCKIQLSEGDFEIGASIIIDHGNMVFEGAGQQATRLHLASGTNDDMFKYDSSSTSYFLVFRDFEAYGNRPRFYPTTCSDAGVVGFIADAGSSGTALVDAAASFDASGVTPVGARVWNVTNATTTTISSVTDANNIVLTADINLGNGDEYCIGNSDSPVRDGGAGNTSGAFWDDTASVALMADLHMQDVWIQNFPDTDGAIKLDGTWGWIIYNATMEFNSGWAIYVSNTVGPNPIKIIISKLIANDKGSIYLNDVDQCQIIGTEVSGGYTDADHAIHIVSTTDNCILTANKITSVTDLTGMISDPNGIQVDGSGNILTSNIFNAGSGTYDWAIEIDTNMTNNIISNNSLRGTYTSGRVNDNGSTTAGLTTKFSNNSLFDTETGALRQFQCNSSTFENSSGCTSCGANYVNIVHGLEVTPDYCIALPASTNAYDEGIIIPLANVGSSTFRITQSAGTCTGTEWYSWYWFCGTSK